MLEMSIEMKAALITTAFMVCIFLAFYAGHKISKRIEKRAEKHANRK